MIIDGAKEIYLDHIERLKKYQSNEEEESCSKKQKCEDKFNQVSGTSGNGTLGIISDLLHYGLTHTALTNTCTL